MIYIIMILFHLLICMAFFFLISFLDKMKKKGKR